MSNKFDNIDLKEAPFKGNVLDFSVGYDAIDKSNIHKHLMIKNRIWNVSSY